MDSYYSDGTKNVQGPVNNDALFAVATYITFGLLFFLPLVAGGKHISRYSVIHANNGMILFMLMFIIGGMSNAIPLVGGVIFSLIFLGGFIYGIIGFVLAVTGQTKPLPLCDNLALVYSFTKPFQATRAQKQEDSESNIAEENPNNQANQVNVAVDQNAPEQMEVRIDKIFAILGYWISILFFVPLVIDKKPSKYSKTHANNQLLILFFDLALTFIAVLVSIILIFSFFGIILLIPFYLLIGILGLASLILKIIGTTQAIQEKDQPLPAVGQITIIS